MKRVIRYVLLFMLFLISAGQILFVLLDNQFTANTYDKISVVLECAPIMCLPITVLLYGRNNLTSKIILLVQAVLFLPLIAIRIFNIYKASNNIDISFIRSITDTTIIILMFIAILLLMHRKKKSYKICFGVIALLNIVVIIMNLSTNNNTSYAITVFTIYFLTVYPFYALGLRTNRGIKFEKIN